MWKQTILSPIGDLHAIWTARGLAGLAFADSPASLDIKALMEPMPEVLQDRSEELDGRIHDYFRTGRLNWPVEGFDWTDVSEFDAQVLQLCMKIPPGTTFTYGQLAKRAGRPNAARAVGGCMARNRWPLLIPCHRVVGANGGLIGYSGRGGTETKKWLLEHEQSHCGALRLPEMQVS